MDLEGVAGGRVVNVGLMDVMCKFTKEPISAVDFEIFLSEVLCNLKLLIKYDKPTWRTDRGTT